MDLKDNANPKHIRSFWPLVIIFTIAALLGGLIIGAAYSNELQDEISSFSFSIHKEPKAAKTSPTSTKPTLLQTKTTK